MAALDNEAASIEERRQMELEGVKGNKDAEAAINEKYNKEANAVKAKQAKADKAQAIISSIINTAVAVTKVWGQTGIFGLAAQIPVLIMGAIQTALIAAQPIPQFYAGTENAPAGAISVAERGEELIKTKSGQMLMANEPTITSGLEGAKIYTNEQTKRIMSGQNQIAGFDSPELIEELKQNNRLTRKAIANQTHYSFQTDRITKTKGNYSETYLNRKLKGIN